MRYYVMRDGVDVDMVKTGTVQDWLTPHTVKDVRAFLGLVLYP